MQPTVAVIIATLNRPANLLRCVDSVLACEYPNFAVIIADQSELNVTPPLMQDKRLRHIRSVTPGKCKALNLALQQTTAEYVLFTDDDCLVPQRWISRHVETLSGEAGIDLIFGALVGAPHDRSRSLIPEFRPSAFTRLHGAWAFLQRGGAGANLAIKRAALESVGLFDTNFGPGSRFLSCEEFDLYCRTLWAGRSAVFDPDNPVLHFGERSYADGSALRLMRGYAFGEGAVLGKHLRSGNARAAAAIAWIAARYTSYMLKCVWRGKPQGAARPFEFLRGAATALVAYRPERWTGDSPRLPERCTPK